MALVFRDCMIFYKGIVLLYSNMYLVPFLNLPTFWVNAMLRDVVIIHFRQRKLQA